MDERRFEGVPVLITGGLGFIGSHLARKLVELGARVTVIDSLIPEYGGNLFNVADLRDRLQVSFTDVRDRYAIAHLIKDQKLLFNLAGQTSHLDSMRDPHTDLEINARAQLTLLETCREHNPDVRLVFASTRQVYGRPRYLPVDEAHPVCPVDVNGINKIAGEQYHLLYNEVYGIEACALRLSNTYGPAMRVKDARQTFLGVWIRNLLDGVPIQVFGDGQQRRDFNYVSDVVEALLAAASNPAAVGEVYNLGSDEVVSLEELAQLLVRLHGSGSYELVPFPQDRKRIDIGDYHADFGKAQRELGWSPTVRLEQGLAATLEYFAEHRAHYWGEP